MAGQSDRYTGGSYTGQTAWLYDSASATTVRVGFVDAEHTGSGGVQLSSANLLNESGLVAGQSDRYTGESYMGQSAWLYDNTSATTTRVGLVDAEHTGSDGVRFSYANLLSQSGLVVGQSDRYLDEQYLGQSAWVYDSASATTARVGLVDAGAPEAAGSQYSYANFSSESGLVAGESARYTGSSHNGQSAWVYDGESAITTRVGFFDADHTAGNGYQFSDVDVLNDVGLAAGQSERWTGGNYLGRSAWLYDSAGDTTTRVGLSEAGHTRSDGTQYSYVSFLNDAGLAAGGSRRFAGAGYLGEEPGSTTQRTPATSGSPSRPGRTATPTASSSTWARTGSRSANTSTSTSSTTISEAAPSRGRPIAVRWTWANS